MMVKRLSLDTEKSIITSESVAMTASLFLWLLLPMLLEDALLKYNKKKLYSMRDMLITCTTAAAARSRSMEWMRRAM